MKKAILILFIIPSLIYCQDLEKKTSKSKNSFMIDISYDSELININKEYSKTQPDDISSRLYMEENFNICVGYSINADGNVYTFDNAVIGLDLTTILHRLLSEDANGKVGLFLRVGRNNFYNHTELTTGGIDIFSRIMPYSFKTGFGYDYFLNDNICLNSKIYYQYIQDSEFGSTWNDNTYSSFIQKVKMKQILLAVGLQIYLRKNKE